MRKDSGKYLGLYFVPFIACCLLAAGESGCGTLLEEESDFPVEVSASLASKGFTAANGRKGPVRHSIKVALTWAPKSDSDRCLYHYTIYDQNGRVMAGSLLGNMWMGDDGQTVGYEFIDKRIDNEKVGRVVFHD